MTATATPIREHSNTAEKPEPRARDQLEGLAVRWLDAAGVELDRLRDLATSAASWQERMAARRLLIDGAVRMSQALAKNIRSPREKKKPAAPEPAALDLPKR